MQNTPTMHPARSFKIPVSVLVVIYTADRQVLLIERADAQGAATGFWQSVTGSLDAVDEPLEAAARREVAEETGIDAANPGHRLTDWQLENIYAIYPTWLHRYARVLRTTQSMCLGCRFPAARR